MVVVNSTAIRGLDTPKPSLRQAIRCHSHVFFLYIKGYSRDIWDTSFSLLSLAERYKNNFTAILTTWWHPLKVITYVDTCDKCCSLVAVDAMCTTEALGILKLSSPSSGIVVTCNKTRTSDLSKENDFFFKCERLLPLLSFFIILTFRNSLS